ncbi:MBL fold metallo-hydrolase [Planctobacterium marinum]|uniref:Metallo-beta-lactamase domain-containing protein n=1 Tax=Planctobacterium marinum TaxID=1631968 RepID=A0AA48KPI9_9ALTE|nr:hypothetical protein MACH26_09990 [Planctobacterium marinum]
MKQVSLVIISLLTYLVFLPVKAKDSVQPLSVKKVSDSVYSIISPYYGLPTPQNKGWNSNSHFVVTDEGVLVIDSGSSEAIGRQIIATVKTVTHQPIRWLVNSHSHADHWLGNGAFKTLNVEIIATESSAIQMQADASFVVEAFNRLTEGQTGNSAIVIPEQQLQAQQSRTLGSLTIEFLMANDGHSPGDILIWLPQEKVIIGGDVLSSDWLPIMTHHGDLAGLISSLDSVLQLQPSVVLTGHGAVTDASSIVRDSRFLTAALAHIKQGFEHKTPLPEITASFEQSFGPTYKSQYKDFEKNCAYLVETIYKSLDAMS